VALACGFASQQHLAHWMRRRLGVTPAQWRVRAPAPGVRTGADGPAAGAGTGAEMPVPGAGSGTGASTGASTGECGVSSRRSPAAPQPAAAPASPGR
jgi:hypothetical protein